LLTQATNVYTWDAANRPVGANVDGVVSSFEYDGLSAPVAQAQVGNRTAQTVGVVTTEYVLDGSAGLTAGVAGGLPEVIVATTGGAIVLKPLSPLSALKVFLVSIFGLNISDWLDG
jgi:YD repeat-containing protein